MDRFTQMAIAARIYEVQKMLSGSFFSVCPVSNLFEAASGDRYNMDYRPLQPLHCINWCNLPANARVEVAEYINDVLAKYIPVDNPGLPSLRGCAYV